MTIKRLISTFAKARQSVIDAIAKFVESDGGATGIMFAKVHEIDLHANQTFIPTAIANYPEGTFINFYIAEDVKEFGFDNSETFTDDIRQFSMDELFYIIQCIEYSKNLNPTGIHYQFDELWK